MRSPVRLVRNTEANRLFDTFLLSAIITILATRLYLQATGFPQIGGDSALHIAHLLPGGFLMMIAILIVVGTINRSSREAASLLGGIGFGLFIDELGKFITKDNDYFFQPAIGLIYISFVVLYLITRYVIRRTYHPHDYLANALDLAMEGVIGELDPREYHRARQLLLQSDSSHPMYHAVADLLDNAKPTKAYRPFIIDRIVDAIHRPFKKLVGKSGFRQSLIRLFVGVGIFLVAAGLLIVFNITGESLRFLVMHPLHSATVISISTTVAGVFIWWGVWQLRKQQVTEALRKFETALLITIFVTQVFLFFSFQLTAITGLLVTLPLLFAVRMLISETR